MTNSLQTLCVLVTRPSPEGDVLAHHIEALDAKTLVLPTIQFVPSPDPEAYQNAIAKLGDQDWLVFTSPQAVYSSVPDIRRYWPEFPSHVQFAAVGAGTARALLHAGYRAVYPEQDWSSEGVMALPEFQSLTGKKIAIIRGVGGRDVLKQWFVDRGAFVLPVVSYQRICPKVDMAQYLAAAKNKIIDVIICTSTEGMLNLKHLFGDSGWPLLRVIPLIVTSDRIKMLAYQTGFQTIWVAQNASHVAILDLLGQKRNELCQIKQRQ